MDYNLPGSSVHGILQARILEWVAIPLPRGSSWPRDWIPVSCIAGRFFTIWATREALLCPDGRTEAHAGGSLATRCEHCLPWDWTSDWITMVLKQSPSEALPVGQTACIFPTCLSGSVSGHIWLLTDYGASSKGLVGLRFLSLLHWGSLKKSIATPKIYPYPDGSLSTFTSVQKNHSSPRDCLWESAIESKAEISALQQHEPPRWEAQTGGTMMVATTIGRASASPPPMGLWRFPRESFSCGLEVNPSQPSVIDLASLPISHRLSAIQREPPLSSWVFTSSTSEQTIPFPV